MIRAALGLALMALTANTHAQHGVLQEARDEVREPKPPKSPTGEVPPTDRDDLRKPWEPYKEEDDFSAMFGRLFTYWFVGAGVVATAPLWGPAVWVGDGYVETCRFAAYPNEGGMCGYVHVPVARSDTKFWSVRTRVEGADNFDGLQRIGTQVLVESAIRLGLDSSFNYYRESLESGVHDDLWTGDANVVFRFAQSEHLTTRAGLGMTWLSDDVGSDFGPNFTYAVDWFPVAPWIISSEFDLGLINDSLLLHLRATAGVNVRHCEFFGGYDWTKIGSADLCGFVGGVRVWY